MVGLFVTLVMSEMDRHFFVFNLLITNMEDVLQDSSRIDKKSDKTSYFNIGFKYLLPLSSY